ncbi:hypothetical protein WJX72_005036 [[Myrmecia] bisecta]|uniref:Glutathione S-transferase family protein n=1 Tax=[Myrmecia] bisecta TaxID=41462 RepID=A0AAW1Q599_9CHLO
MHVHQLRTSARPIARCHGTAATGTTHDRAGSRRSILDGSALREHPREALNIPGTSLLLLTHTGCPYAARAWLAVLEKEIDFLVVHVDLANKPGWFLQLAPRGLVPAVEFRGQVVTESIDICRWLDANFPGPDLIPEAAAFHVNQLLEASEAFTNVGLRYLAGGSRLWGIDGRQSPQTRADYARQLQRLASSLDKSGGPYLAGQHVSVADLVYFPFVERFDVAMREFNLLNTEKAMPAVWRWLQTMHARESCQIVSANPRKLAEAYKQHSSLDFFDYCSYSTLSLHPHLEQLQS